MKTMKQPIMVNIKCFICRRVVPVVPTYTSTLN